MALVLMASRAVVGEGAGWIVASMGASAVLLFAVPHGPLSQPWQVVAGHIVPAIIGVACARWIANPVIAGALAVGIAIFAMRALACIHPPGGATALAAVIGGPEIHALGFAYVLYPVLLNVVILLSATIAFNYPFAWRRYPAALHRMDRLDDLVEARPPIEHADLVYALSELDTFIDVSEQDLLRIYELAIHHSDAPAAPIHDIKPHAYYSNGRYGADWQVREVLEIRAAGDDGRHVVTFRIAAGTGRRRTEKSGLLAFRRWAKYRVERNENSWQRVFEMEGDKPVTTHAATTSASES